MTHPQDTTPANPAQTEKLGRFGWHPDPATDFETEVHDLECEVYHHRVAFLNGTPPLDKIRERIAYAMTFRVGGVETAVLAKQRLRELEKEAAALANPAQVTDAMVEAGHNGLEEWRRLYVNKDEVRAILTAAIGAGGQAVAWRWKPNYPAFDWKYADGSERPRVTEEPELKPYIYQPLSVLSALTHPVQPGWREIPVNDETISYVMRYGGRCRDCADAMGVCPTSGLPCDPHEARAAIRHVLRAVNYGFGEGFLSFPAAPQPKGE